MPGASPIIASTPAAEAAGVSKRFGATQALDDVSIAVQGGESHALVGRNGAGKSTLVALLTGLISPDAGEIRFGGAAAPPTHARDAWRARVACVYQRPTVVPDLSVAENLFLNSQPRRVMGFIDWRVLRAKARDVLAEWGVDVDVNAPAAQLSIEQRQLVEIVRALHQGARFVILDEPTAQLDSQSARRLFDHIRRLRASGITFLYISHHLPEIFEVCDSVTVLRNGRHILSRSLDGLTRDDVVSAMVGEHREPVIRPRGNRVRSDAEPILAVRDLRLQGDIGPLSFKVCPGEFVGLAGQRPSGALSVGRALFGLERPLSGEIAVSGRVRRLRSPAEALAAGVGYVPEDRHESGVVPEMTVADNSTMTALPSLARAGFINLRRQRNLARTLMEEISIKAAVHDKVDRLSGGNQQKVVMARAVATEPSVLVLLHPTAGVDVASKDVLFEAIAEAGEEGTGTVIVSDELDELRRCDRVLVMFGGRVVATHDAGWRDDELIAELEGAG